MKSRNSKIQKFNIEKPRITDSRISTALRILKRNGTINAETCTYSITCKELLKILPKPRSDSDYLLWGWHPS